MSDLFQNSKTSGRLLNVSWTDYGKIQQAKVSVGNVPVGIFRQGQKPKKIFSFSNLDNAKTHGPSYEAELKKIVLTSNIRQSLKNVREKLFLNFADLKNLLLTTLTINTSQKKITYKRAPWSVKTCFFANCRQKHEFQQLDLEIAAKLSGKNKTSVQSIFYEGTETINRQGKPSSGKGAAFFEPQKRKIWHVHILSTPYLPPETQHKNCGISTQKKGCGDCQFALYHLWPYGLANIRPVKTLREGGKTIKTSERLVNYLSKYLTKCFYLRQNNPQLATEMGLKKGISLHKFFRGLFVYPNDQKEISGKIEKPKKNSLSWLNLDSSFSYQAAKMEKYLISKNGKLKVKKNARQLAENCINTNRKNILNGMEKALAAASNSKITTNHYWKKCVYEETVNTCPLTIGEHLSPLIRGEFNFNGSKSYAKGKNELLPELYNLKLAEFTKFENYQPKEQDYNFFDNQAQYPGNGEIQDHSRECFGCYAVENAATETDWKRSLPLKSLYNYGYLSQIREQIKNEVEIDLATLRAQAKNNAARFGERDGGQ